MSNSCIKKQDEIRALFATCPNQDEKYKKIIELGKQLPRLKLEDKNPENIVKGCQSVMYLHTFTKNGLIYFEAESEALISSGLAAILLHVYNGETAETILTCPPTFLDDLGISASLTPSRANGLYSVHLRMKQEALKILTKK